MAECGNREIHGHSVVIKPSNSATLRNSDSNSVALCIKNVAISYGAGSYSLPALLYIMKKGSYILSDTGYIYNKIEKSYFLKEELLEIQTAITQTLKAYTVFGITQEKIEKANAKAKLAKKPKKRVDVETTNHIKEIFEEWKAVLKHPTAILSVQRIKRIQARINDGFAIEDLKLVPHGVKKSPYHMGNNPTSTIYDKIDTVYRDVEQVERFIGLAKMDTTKKIIKSKCQFCEWYKEKPSIIPCEIHSPDLFKQYFERKNARKSSENLQS